MIFQRWLVRAFWQSDGLGNLLTLWIDPFSKSEQKIIWVKFRAFAGKGEKLPCGELLIDGGAVEPISFINQTIHQSRKQVMGLTCCVVKTMILMALTQYHRKYYCCTKFCTFELQLNCVFGPRLRVNLRRINEIWKENKTMEFLPRYRNSPSTEMLKERKWLEILHNLIYRNTFIKVQHK